MKALRKVVVFIIAITLMTLSVGGTIAFAGDRSTKVNVHIQNGSEYVTGLSIIHDGNTIPLVANGGGNKYTTPDDGEYYLDKITGVFATLIGGSVVPCDFSLGVEASGTLNITIANITPPVTPAPAIDLTKSVSDGPHYVGDAVTYTFTVTNTGNVALTGVVVSDPMFDGTGTMWTIGDLAAGTTVTHTETYTPTEAGTVDNTATAIGHYDETAVDDTDTVSFDASTPPVTPEPAIDLIKSVGDGPYYVGSAVTYTFTVTNTGNVALTGVVVSDPMFNGTGTMWAIGDLAAGATATHTETYTPTEAVTVNNTATATGHYGETVVDKTASVSFDATIRPPTPPTPPTPPAPPAVTPEPPAEEPVINIAPETIPGGSIDNNANKSLSDVEVMTLENEAVPAGAALPESLPQTGGIPAESLYGLGSILAAAGLFLRRKFN